MSLLRGCLSLAFPAATSRTINQSSTNEEQLLRIYIQICSIILLAQTMFISTSDLVIVTFHTLPLLSRHWSQRSATRKRQDRIKINRHLNKEKKQKTKINKHRLKITIYYPCYLSFLWKGKNKLSFLYRVNCPHGPATIFLETHWKEESQLDMIWRYLVSILQHL